MAVNDTVLQDEDGDFSDWIEIHNPDETPINLSGWFLTDDASKSTKWTIPNVTIPANGFLLIYCSNKNKRDPASPLHTNFALSSSGEYLALIKPDGITVADEFSPSFPQQYPDISYGRAFNKEIIRLITENGPVRWIVPTSSSDPGQDWIDPEFDDSSWNPANMGLGYDRRPTPYDFNPYIGEGGNTESEIYNNQATQSTFVRIPFTVPNKDSLSSLTLNIRIDDGFVVWLNGSPVTENGNPVQFNAPSPIQWNSDAITHHPDEQVLTWLSYDISENLHQIVTGENILAVQFLNHGNTNNNTSSDALLQVSMDAETTTGTTDLIGYLSIPTPGAPNGPAETMILPTSPTIPVASKTFIQNFTIPLSVPPNLEIRYTLDGTEPTASSTLYTDPVPITSSSLLKAIYRNPETGATSRSSSAHYEKLHHSLANYQNSGTTFKSALPIMVLNNINYNGEPIRNKRPARMMVFDRNSSGYANLDDLPSYASDINVSLHGSTSAGWPKKPYNIELTDDSGTGIKESILGLPETEDFSLISCYDFDRAFMRNAWIYQAAIDAGFPAPHFRFVEVFFNQNQNDLIYDSPTAADYKGVYLLVQKVRTNKGSADLRSLAASENDLPNISGGYIIKIDRKDDEHYWWYTNRGQPEFTPGPLIIYRPKIDKVTSEQINYVKNYIQAFEDALYTDSENNFNTRNYTNWIDPDSWSIYNLLNMFPKNVDALRLSTYYYKPRGRRIAGGSLWDFDRSANNDNNSDFRDQFYNTWNGLPDATNYFTYSWYSKLFQDIEFRQLYVDNYLRLRRNGSFSETYFENLFDSFLAEFRVEDAETPATRDYARWYQGRGNLITYVDKLKTWLINRGNWIDSQFVTAPAASLPSGIVPKNQQISLTQPVGTTVYYTLDGTDPRNPGGSVSDTALIYHGEPITVNETIRLRARTWQEGQFSVPATNWSGMEERYYLVDESYATRDSLALHALHILPTDPDANEVSRFPEADASHYQWIELTNRSNGIINLAGVSLTHTNPVSALTLPDFSLAPGETALIVKDAAAFRFRYGDEAASRIVAEWTGDRSLSPTDAKIELLERDGITSIASFKYKSEWLDDFVDEHHPMIYIGTDQADESYKTATNWIASSETDGTPGQPAEINKREIIHLWEFSGNNLDDFLEPAFGNGALHYQLGDGGEIIAESSGKGFPLDHLRLNNPLGSSLTFYVPTSGYESIGITTLTRRSGKGAGTQHWQWSADGSTFEPLLDFEVPDSDPVPLVFPLPILEQMENRHWLTLQVTFSKGDGGTSGNNRFANFTVTGIPIDPAPEPEGFEEWRRNHFTPEELRDLSVSGPKAVPIGDGTPNLTKYALGLAPNDILLSPLQFTSPASGEHEIRFTRPFGLTDIEYILLESSNLHSWTPVEPYLIHTEPLSETVEEIRLPAPTLSEEDNSRFYRLQIKFK